jgi:gliding motility-associated-like protein
MVRLLRCLFILLTLFSGAKLYCQNETAKWYFAQWSALDFMSNPPIAVSGCSMGTHGGSASIADSSGNLLFYCNGDTVYTANNTIMANGLGLYAVGSGPAQACMILKKMGSSTNYYLFTLQVNTYAPGLYYSEIDMSLASGSGSVIAKNIPIYQGKVGEKLTATRHCNGSDIWIVIRDWNFNNIGGSNFLSFLVTPSGISTTPVVSNIWMASTCTGAVDYGCMKISPNGKKLAAAVAFYWMWPPTLSMSHGIELWDFDNSTGVVSNSIALAVNSTTISYQYGYGVEFSPDGTKLYASKINNNQIDHGTLVQFDLCAGSPAAIAASVYTLDIYNTPGCWGVGTLQLAKNKKLYVANYSANTSNFISVVNNPNGQGASCSYSFHSQSTGTGRSAFGLPNFMGSIFYEKPPPVPFTYTSGAAFGCQNVGFEAQTCGGMGFSLQNVLWDFGDPGSGSANASTLNNPVHAYPAVGNYSVQLILYYTCGGGSDTINQVIYVNQPCLNVTSTSVSCASLGSATINISGPGGPFNFTWTPTNQTGSVATNLSPGNYTVYVYDVSTSFGYTEQITLAPAIPFSYSISYQPTVACYGAQTATATVINVVGASPSQSYTWTNGNSSYTSPTPSLSAGVWSLTITDNVSACTSKRTFTITQPPQTTLVLSSSSATACAGTNIVLHGIASGGSPPYSYSWTAGPASNNYTTSQGAGSYSYVLSALDSKQCITKDTIAVSFIPNPVLTLSSPSICALETGSLHVTGANTYLWSDSSTGNTFTASPSSSTVYSVIGSAFGCTTSASAIMFVMPLPVPVFTSNSPRCNGEMLNLSAAGGVVYKWSGPQNFTSNSANPTITAASPSQSGQYSFTVAAANGCTASTSGAVVVNSTPSLSASGSTVCVTGTLVLTSSSEPGATYLWTGPQSFSSTQQNPSVLNPLVNMTGNYSITAYSTFNCSNTAVVDASVASAPVPSFVTNSPLCDQKTLTFNSSSTTGGVNFRWNGPDNFISHIPNPTISPVGLRNAGEYTLTVSEGPCMIATTGQIIVNALPQPIVTGPDEICENRSFGLSVSDPSHQIVSWYWQYPMGGSNQQSIFVDSVKPYNGGIYTATVTDVNGCKGAGSKIIRILANPTITATGDKVCLNAPAKLTAEGADIYLWTGKNLSANNGPQAIVSKADYLNPETYFVVGTSAKGCTASTSAQVLTTQLPDAGIVIRPKNKFCVNEEMVLEGSGGAFYQWTTPLGDVYTGQTMRLIIKNTQMAGEYSLTVTDAYGCRNTTLTSIAVELSPDGALTSPIWDACAPFCADFKFKPAWISPKTSAEFTLDGRLLGSNAFQKCFLTPGEYVIKAKLTDSITGCNNIQSYLVNARAKPAVMFSWEPEKPVEIFDEVKLFNASVGEGQYSWAWHIEGATKTIRSEDASYTFQDAGLYRVAYVVANTWGCIDTLVRTIEVTPDFSFYMPDAFTPNGDERNDQFIPTARGVKKYVLQVFNRWGEKMFETDQMSSGWDGTFLGEPCKTDAYVWKVVVSTNTGEQKEFQGHVTLIR